MPRISQCGFISFIFYLICEPSSVIGPATQELIKRLGSLLHSILMTEASVLAEIKFVHLLCVMVPRPNHPLLAYYSTCAS